MNFFQSVFSDDPDPSTPSQPESQNPQNPNPNPSIPSISSAWTFGTTLIQTLASKSDSVIQTYRHDLHEFTSAIKQETAVIRQAAVKAVNDLPASLEAGAGFAHDSLESVGQAIEDLGTTVTDIIAPDYYYYSDTDNNIINNSVGNRELGFTKPYSRLDAQVRMIGSDMNTYLNEVDDVIEYDEWRLGFRFDEKVGEIEDIMNENDGVVREIYKEIVPERVDEETFWVRYFFRVYKVKKAEEARVELVKRAIAGEGDEELSWDVDEDDYEEDVEAVEKIEEEAKISEDDDVEKGVSGTKNEERNEVEVDKLEGNLDAKTALEVKTDRDSDISIVSSQPSPDEDVKTALEVKTDRDSDISIVSSQPSPDEDGWDEIEDIGSGDENKDKIVSHGSHGSADRAELRKRLTVAEDEEDLTWDIEDDDDEETVKE